MKPDNLRRTATPTISGADTNQQGDPGGGCNLRSRSPLRRRTLFSGLRTLSGTSAASMTIIHFITHPEVIIDPATPVPDWRLSPVGIRRMQLAARQPWITAVGTLFCSAERKAREAAEVLAPHVGLILSTPERKCISAPEQRCIDDERREVPARPSGGLAGWHKGTGLPCRCEASNQGPDESVPAKSSRRFGGLKLG